MKNYFEKTLFYLYTVLFFLTPLLFVRSTEEHYEFPKMIFVYFIAATIVLFYLLRKLVFGIKEKVKPDTAVVVFLLIFIASTLFSSHFYTSLWGYYSRFNDGLVSFLAFFLIYYVGINIFNKQKIELLTDFLLLPLLPIGLYSLYQALSLERVYSTFGQPNWLAAYIVFLFPLLVRKILSETIKQKRIFWIIISFVSILSLWFTYSLSGLLAFFVIGAFMIYKSRPRNTRGIILFGGILFLLLIFGFGYFKDRVFDALNFSSESQTYNISDSGIIRLGLWSSSAKMSVSNPKVFLVGIGPETFPYEFPFFRDNVLNYTSEWSYILNKPHNYYLEIIIESGVFALLAYMVILATYISKKDTFFVAGMLGFVITNIFGWPTVTTAMVFWYYLISSKADARDGP